MSNIRRCGDRICQFKLTFCGDAAMPIYSLEDGVFDSETTALMGKAFEAACEELHFPKDKLMRDHVARQIIAAARRGELDPLRLRSVAVLGISHITT
jgi:hypothetical protein